MILQIFVSLTYPDVPRELYPPMIFKASDSLESELVSWCPDLFPLDLDLSLLVFSLVMPRSSNLLDLLGLGCRVPQMAPNVEVNLRGLLDLGKSDLNLNEYMTNSGVRDSGPLQGLYLCRIVLRYCCARTELITPNLICPSTHQLLRSSGGDSGPDMSFDKSESLERLFSLARVRLAGASKLPFSSGFSEGDYTSSECLTPLFGRESS
ncbi:hypothetical protein Tco_1164445 [Tanacetum coccineum]